MVKTEKAPMVAALLAVLWAFGAPAVVEASLPLDAPSSRVFKTTDPFAMAPQLDLPSLTQQLRAVEERRIAASECVSLCELAAGIEAHPFGVAALEPRNRSEDAWGNYRFTSELETSHNRFGFTGHYWDKEASLYYAKARYYDPFTARFTQADSFLGTIDDPPSLHRYFYAADNPTFFVDPTGHEILSGGCYTGGACGAPSSTGPTQTEKDLFRASRLAGGVLKQTAGGLLDLFDLTLMAVHPLHEQQAQQQLAAIPGTMGREAVEYGKASLAVAKDPSLVGQSIEELGSDRAFEAYFGGTLNTALAVDGVLTLGRGAIRTISEARMISGQSRGLRPSMRSATAANYESFGGETLDDALRMKEQPFSPKSGSPPQLTAGRAWEDTELASLGKDKNTNVWRPSAEDINSAAFKVIVGPAKYTKGGLPVGTTVDIAETAGSVEIKGGTKMMESSYQLRLQTYRALKMENPLTIRTTRPINGVFTDWLKRWGVKVENPSAAAGTAAPPGTP